MISDLIVYPTLNPAMEPPSPSYILINSSEAVMDMYFWEKKFSSLTALNESAEEPTQDNCFLIAGYGNRGGVDIWDLTARRVVKNFISEHGVLSVFGTQQGEVVYLNKEGDFRIFDVNCTNPKLSLQISNVAFCKMSCINDADRLLCAMTGHEESSISVWDLRTEKVISFLNINSGRKLGMVMTIKLLEKDNLLCLGAYESGCLILWDVEKQSELHSLEIFHMEPIMCFDFAVSQMAGVAGSPSQSLKKIVIEANADSHLEIKLSKTRMMKNPGVSDVKVRPDCKIVAAGGWHDGSVRVFSFKSLKPLAVLSYHSGTVQSIVFRNVGESAQQILASGSMTNKIAIWKIYND